MDLPIKHVDIVTLLFVGLLAVIIVFFLLQRNFKRSRRRNDKDSHYISCKSIPKDIKNAIERKHIISNSYKEPPDLLSETDLKQQDDKDKTYIIRMKAFEIAKYLERALMECGYRRSVNIKLEDFIDDLVTTTEDKSLPKSLLNDFVNFYVWAMHDPMAFTNQHLRKFNQLINRILDHLAMNKKDISENIKQFKLDLNNNGDFDFNKFFIDKDRLLNTANLNNNNNTTTKKSTKKETLNNKSKESYQACTSAAATAISAELFELEDVDNYSEEETPEHFNKSNSKRKILNNKSNKRLFQKKNTSNEMNLKSTNEPVATASSFAIVGQQRSIKDKRSKSKYEDKKSLNLIDDSLENINLIETKIDHSLANDSIKTIFDSENEEIPLVGTSSKKSSYHKKKSSHSSITLLNQKIKNQSTPPLKQANISNQTSVVTLPVAAAATSVISTNIVNNENMVGINAGFGEENEGFNETMI